MKSNSKSILIRPVVKSEHPILLELWSRSVSATHHFLTRDDIARLYQQLQDQWLDLVEIWVLDVSTEIVGFIGFDENSVEMLFIEPNHFRKGYGQLLINFAKQSSREIFLDVNEQNPQALTFYQKQGFQVLGRSETDSQGNPFPLLHLVYS